MWGLDWDTSCLIKALSSYALSLGFFRFSCWLFYSVHGITCYHIRLLISNLSLHLHSYPLHRPYEHPVKIAFSSLGLPGAWDYRPVLSHQAPSTALKVHKPLAERPLAALARPSSRYLPLPRDRNLRAILRNTRSSWNSIIKNQPAVGGIIWVQDIITTHF